MRSDRDTGHELLAVYRATDPVAWRTRVADRRALAVLAEVEARGRGSIREVAAELDVHESQVKQWLAQARKLRQPRNKNALASALSLPLDMSSDA